MKIKNIKSNKRYSALGTCGMSNGILFEGELTSIDSWGAYLKCDRVLYTYVIKTN
ncbi:hypothetical protein HYO65_gp097 [Tenacibaculum phage PTm1]|uniref:Uncharacterized protein n=2 Tax=Shirahamavirus PTm1 TaxID=2846435 RepID=A0A5S9ERS7_9CAUD|nr:hypothetical protein HYO65_gp097 [Tenacibaculum phage PTm1]BBI90489.1 hypothetical protein [Tenacibaculum phage PTm1]BBI90797.1 hypothetical protein [Tenacibaculum phage PTm5]